VENPSSSDVSATVVLNPITGQYLTIFDPYGVAFQCEKQTPGSFVYSLLSLLLEDRALRIALDDYSSSSN